MFAPLVAAAGASARSRWESFRACAAAGRVSRRAAPESRPGPVLTAALRAQLCTAREAPRGWRPGLAHFPRLCPPPSALRGQSRVEAAEARTPPGARVGAPHGRPLRRCYLWRKCVSAQGGSCPGHGGDAQKEPENAVGASAVISPQQPLRERDREEREGGPASACGASANAILSGKERGLEFKYMMKKTWEVIKLQKPPSLC